MANQTAMTNETSGAATGIENATVVENTTNTSGSISGGRRL